MPADKTKKGSPALTATAAVADEMVNQIKKSEENSK